MTRRRLGSVTKIGKGRYRIQITVGRDPVTGKPRRFDRTIHGSPQDAERELARLALEAGAQPSANLTLRQYVESMWIPEVSRTTRDRTWHEYESKMKLHVLPSLGALKLDAIKPYQLDRWMNGLAESGLSPRTRLHVYRVLHNALHQAVRWQQIASNPLEAVRAPKVEQTSPDVLTVAEMNAYLDAFVGNVVEPIVLLAFAAGLRRSELAALDWSDLTFGDHPEVSIHRGYHERGGRVWFEEPKSVRSRRTIALPSWAAARLKTLRGVGPLVSESGERMKPSRISALYDQRVNAGVRAKTLRRVPLRNLRHTHATIALAQGVDLKVLQDRMGHSTMDTTARFYLNPGRSADELAAGKLDALRDAR